MSEDTRDRILDAAFQQVARVGLRRLALGDVATVAGVSRQTLYRHFGSREGLVEELVLREERWFIARVEAAAGPHADAEGAIAAGVAEAIDAASDHPLLRRLLETEPGEILPVVVLGKGPVISAARDVVATVLGERVDMAPDRVAQLADVCSRLLVSYVLDPGADPPRVVGHRMARMLMRGVASES